jgi:hypothetical protein
LSQEKYRVLRKKLEVEKQGGIGRLEGKEEVKKKEKEINKRVVGKEVTLKKRSKIHKLSLPRPFSPSKSLASKQTRAGSYT